MSDLDNLGAVVAEQVNRVSLGQQLLWEEKLRLHIKPKPSWCPESLWVKLLGIVLTQSLQK